MTQSLGKDAWKGMILRAAYHIRENRDRLTRLDSAGGDGDHGITMARAMDLIERTVAGSSSDTLHGLLDEVAWAMMGVDGGATGPLFGSFFLAMASAAKEVDVVTGPALACIFEAGLEGVLKRTRARVGDKTLVDALEPAVKALAAAAGAGASPADALGKAAEAGEAGAAATRDIQARFGRARNVGEKSVGTEDPGAVSVSLLFRGFSEGARYDDKTMKET